MKYSERRKLGKLFPEIKETIMAEEVCFDDIFEEINKKEPLRERFLKSKEIPEEWAFCCASDIGDRETLRGFIQGSLYAYMWAFYIGDKELMRDRIVDSDIAFLWARDIGNKEIMRPLVMGTEYEGEWFDQVEKGEEE